MLTLFDYFRSSASYRVRIALNLKGLEYQLHPVHLLNQGGEQHTAAYHKINPQGLVPVLQDGQITLTQSLAIIEYLNETHPNPNLLPSLPHERALVRAFALAIAADIHPLNNLRVLKYLTHDLEASEDDKTMWYKHWTEKGLKALEEMLLRNKMSGEFCFGNTPTIADICLVPLLYNAKRFACDITEYPLLIRIDERCAEHPAFAKAYPIETVT